MNLTKSITNKVFEGVIDITKDMSFDKMISMVTTKGGFTEAGLISLNDEVISDQLNNAFLSAYHKTSGIGK